MVFKKNQYRDPNQNGDNAVSDKSQSLYALPSHLRVDVAFEGLMYKVPTSCRRKEYKTLLKGVSGEFRSSELTAILGPSGAGKSTLMNVLAGYKTRNVSGVVKVNGHDRDLNVFRKLSCYIMENDELLPHLTVLESMTVSANLKLSGTVSSSRKSKIVDEILDKLGLTECKDTRADKLSKGQRKRLSIAHELVNNPPLMFFDEPTSGLDSQSCYQCIRLLKSLAIDGRTIVCTIHQPSAKLFEMFDRLFVLAEGTCIYKGTVPALLPYLKSQSLICPPYHNPADFVIEVACGEYGYMIERLSECVRAGVCENVNQLCIVDKSKLLPSEESTNRQDPSGGTEVAIAISTPPSEEGNKKKRFDIADRRLIGANPFTQFYVLFMRTTRCILRDTFITHLRFAVHLLVGVLIGILYFGIGNDGSKTLNNAAFLFFSILFIMFTAMMPVVVTFPLEMNVFIREHLNCWYGLKPYYFAKTMADVPFQVLFPITYSSIVYWMTGQPPDAMRFLMYLLLSVMISLTSQSLGLLIGAASSIQVAVFLGPAIAIPILLFCGFFVTVHTIPSYLQWLSYLSYIRYAYEGVVLTIYGFNRPATVCETLDVQCFLSDPKVLLQTLDVHEENYWLDLGMLGVFFVVFRFGCYCVLRWRIWNQK